MLPPCTWCKLWRWDLRRWGRHSAHHRISTMTAGAVVDGAVAADPDHRAPASPHPSTPAFAAGSVSSTWLLGQQCIQPPYNLYPVGREMNQA